MCLCRKLAAAVFAATLLTSCSSADKTFAADASASVVHGNVRFQVLSPSLVRMEYSPKSSFVDEASVAVVGRSNFAGVAPKTSEKDGWLTLSTEKMTVSYKLGSGPFSKDNLRIAWSDKSGGHWKPGDQDAKNLGRAGHDGRPQHGRGDRAWPLEPQRLLLARRQPHRIVRQSDGLGEAAAGEG